jgi:hypothetical protein
MIDRQSVEQLRCVAELLGQLLQDVVSLLELFAALWTPSGI